MKIDKIKMNVAEAIFSYYLRYMRVIILLILLILSQPIALAQIEWSDFDNYTRYSEKHGLSSNKVYNIVEDKAGFLWIGSNKGVSRFDGSNFVNYQYYYEDDIPRTIGDVLDLVIDNKGEYIYITSRSGVLMSSLKETRFKHIKSFYPSIDFEIGNCRSLYLDSDSDLWAGLGGKGLLKITLKRNGHKLIQLQTLDKTKAKFESNYQVHKIVPDNKSPNILWLGTSEGLIEFNKIKETYKIYYYKNSQELFQRYIKQILPINNKLYIGTNAANWYVFNKIDNTSNQIIPRSSELFHYDIIGLHQDDNANIWITSPEGLVQYSPEKMAIIYGASNTDNVRGITLIDSRGLIWFTGENGLYKYTPDPVARFIEIKKINEAEYPTPMAKIIKVKEHYYVCPVWGLDIYKINSQDFNFSSIKVYPLRQNRDYSLRDMTKMQDNKLLLLGNQRTYIFDTDTETFTEPSIQVPDISTIYLRTIAKDKDENYWVGTNKNGLYKFNYDSLTFKRYKNLFKGRTNRDHLFIKKLFVDSQNKLWIGQASTSVLNLEDNTINFLNPDFDYEIFIPFGEFTEDNNNRIWVANTFDGISYVDQQKIEAGLNKVLEGSYSGVYIYSDSLLWTVGEGKLGLLNSRTMSHQRLNLKTKTNVTGPIVAMENGDFMIGCENGVLIYNHEKQLNNNDFPNVYIHRIKGNNEVLYQGNSFDNFNFTFPSGTKNLDIKISALAFQDPNQYTYQYKSDDIWNDFGASMEFNLSNLRQGDYDVNLRVENSVGNISKPLRYIFTIKPYWYTSNLAFLVYILLLAGLLYRFYKFNLNRKLALAESQRVTELDELKSKMFANITHEFRTPLTVIEGMANALENNPDKFPKKNLALIKKNSKNLLALVNQMLDLSKLQARKVNVDMRQDDVNLFIKYLVANHESFANLKNVGLQFYSEEQELWIDFDARKLEQILTNLISNAVKFTPEFGKVLVVTKKIKHNNQSWLELLVQDNGIGISTEQLPYIFDRFHQANPTHANQGTGIGLALVKELTTLMEGTIHIESELKKGTTVTLLFPIRNKAPLKSATDEYTFETLSAKEVTSDYEQPVTNDDFPILLIIEDNADVTYYLKTCLQDQYQIITSLNGKEGVEKALEEVPDIIISDVMMPEMDGFEVCKIVKEDERTSHIPIILLTAKATSEDKLIGLKHGADAYLIKPFEKAELLIRLDKLLEIRKTLQKKYSSALVSSEPSVAAVKNKEDSFVEKVEKILLGHLEDEDFSVHELAHELHLSRSQVHRKIKALTGMSAAIYIRHIRLKKAKELLHTTDLNISEIAYRTGFRTPVYFSQVFKETFGESPSATRK